MGKNAREYISSMERIIHDLDGMSWINNPVEFKVRKETVKDPGGGSHNQSATATQEKGRVDDHQWVKNGIDAPDSPCGINHECDQNDITEALQVNIYVRIGDPLKESEIDN